MYTGDNDIVHPCLERIAWREKEREGTNLPDESLHLDKVDDAREVGLVADGELEHEGSRAEKVDDGVNGLVEVCGRESAQRRQTHEPGEDGRGNQRIGKRRTSADAIHLVDEAHAGDVVLVGLAPHSLGLRLDARHAVEDSHSAVKHTERTLDLEGEVNVACKRS
eukprot:3934942-Rhodomonas_salina.1